MPTLLMMAKSNFEFFYSIILSLFHDLQFFNCSLLVSRAFRRSSNGDALIFKDGSFLGGIEYM